MSFNEYVGLDAIIHDGDGNKVTKAVICAHDKKYNWITIKDKLQKIKDSERLSVLVLTKEGVHEYKGTLRRPVNQFNDTCELALYKKRVVENRRSTRYVVNLDAVIENCVVNEKLVPLKNPCNVKVLNFSSGGALIRSEKSILDIGDMIELFITLGVLPMRLYGKVLRKNDENLDYVDYSCQFKYFDKPLETI